MRLEMWGFEREKSTKKRFSVSFLCSLPIYKKFVVRNPPDVPIYFSLIFWKIAVLIHRCILLWLVDCLFVVFVSMPHILWREPVIGTNYGMALHIKTSMQMPPLSRDCEQRCDLNPRPIDQIMSIHVCVDVLVPVWFSLSLSSYQHCKHTSERKTLPPDLMNSHLESYHKTETIIEQIEAINMI
jgi:hypothetical protein